MILAVVCPSPIVPFLSDVDMPEFMKVTELGVMKILFCIRNDYLTNFAGDTKQLLETEDYLKKKGLSVVINSGEITDYSEYDIIHLFNLTRITETYRYYKTAKKFNKIIVISPIYWDLQKYYRFINDRQSISLWNYYKMFRNEIIKGCSMVYPGSRSEMRSLQKDYENEFPYCIIPSGVSEVKKGLGMPDNILPSKPYLFCAARICPRKNQLELCKAANQIGIKLILAGGENDKSYLERCMAFQNVQYWGLLSEKELQPLYKNASLHVLCSFVETPGLASLEAGFLGTDIVSTCEGSSEEYFKNFSSYCDPYDKNSIRESILSALSNSKQPALKHHIENNFLWDNCLSALIESYRNLLAK